MGADNSKECNAAKCNNHASDEFTSGDRKNLFNNRIQCNFFRPTQRMHYSNPYFTYQNWNEVSLKNRRGEYNLCGGDLCGSGGTNSFVKKSKHAIEGHNRFMVFWRTSTDEDKGSNCNRLWWDDPVRSSTSDLLLEHCKKACYNTEWCQSFDMHRKLGRCYLSDKTQHNAKLISTDNYDYYEKKPELA